MQEDEESYYLTELGNDSAERLLAGVSPSEIGHDWLGAAIILYMYGATVNDERAIELAKTYAEADRATNPKKRSDSV